MTQQTSHPRRRFLAAAGGAAAAAAAAPTLAMGASPSPDTARALPFLIGRSTDTLAPRGKSPRVVICGGGWGGVTAAKYLRQYALILRWCCSNATRSSSPAR
ncbi:hypothetical protein [Thauera humireducens]|uniref:hypothetical protein n=1 Tax=Thauera humireducens TaxID=1134435 RepID=UPI003120256F